MKTSSFSTLCSKAQAFYAVCMGAIATVAGIGGKPVPEDGLVLWSDDLCRDYTIQVRVYSDYQFGVATLFRHTGQVNFDPKRYEFISDAAQEAMRQRKEYFDTAAENHTAALEAHNAEMVAQAWG